MTDYSELARDCGAASYTPPPLRAVRGLSFTFDQLRAFAERVRQDERERIGDTLSSALQSDLENGVKWLNELASSAFSAEYPALHKALAAVAQQVPERAE